MNISKNTILTSCIVLANIAWLGEAAAVGGGLQFELDEDPIALPNIFNADSLDFTYHACTEIDDNGLLSEAGYYWNSSFQDEDSVVDSQINHFLANGYHIYALYDYDAVQRGNMHATITGERINYEVSDGEIEMRIDPLSDTTLQLSTDCKITIGNNSDDWLLGSSGDVVQGEKSETDGLAQGDFKIVFGNWKWDQAAIMLMTPSFGTGYGLYDFNYLVFNGNITGLGGPLGYDHSPEGSGNVFWLYDFVPLPILTD